MLGDGLLRIEYGLVRQLWANPDQDQLDVWDVTLETGSFIADLDDDEDGAVWTAVARATLFGMDPERQALIGQLPFDVADAHSADAAYYYEHVFGAGGQLPSLSSLGETGSSPAMTEFEGEMGPHEDDRIDSP